MSLKFTRIPYQYVDASNYKAGAVIFVSGSFSPEQRLAIQAKLYDGMFFIPPQLGLRALQPDLPNFPSEDDHVWHQLDTVNFEELEALPDGKTVASSAAEFAAKFQSVEWDIRREYDRLGLDDID